MLSSGPTVCTDAYCSVWRGRRVLCVPANGRETIKIELLKCKGCLIQWFIQIRYECIHRGHMGACRTELTCDQSLSKLGAFTELWDLLYLLVFFSRQCTGASEQYSSNAQRSRVVSQTVHRCILQNEWFSQRVVVVFNNAGLSTARVQVAHPFLTFLLMSFIWCSDVLSVDHQYLWNAAFWNTSHLHLKSWEKSFMKAAIHTLLPKCCSSSALCFCLSRF